MTNAACPPRLWQALISSLTLLSAVAFAAERESGAEPSTETGEVLQGDAAAIAALGDIANTRSVLQGYVYTRGGYDTNANGATSADRIELPGFGGVILDLGAEGTETSDSFAELGAGLSVRKPLPNSFAFVAAADTYRRFNQSEDQVETSTVTGFAGGNYAWSNTDNLTLAVQVERFRFAHQRFRNANGMFVQYHRQVSTPVGLNVYGQFARLDYPTQRFRNADRMVAGVDLARVFSARLNPYAYIGVYTGLEDERGGGEAAFAHRLRGLRIGGQIYLSSKFLLFSSANAERRDYRAADVFFLVARHDTQKDFKLGLSYYPVPSWSLTTQFNYTRNRSNVQFNDFARSQISLTLRRDFK